MHLLYKALEVYLQQLEEAWIDEEFTRIKRDEIYKAVNLQIAEEFPVQIGKLSV